MIVNYWPRKEKISFSGAMTANMQSPRQSELKELKMSKEFNPKAYARLLAETLPGVITTREEYDRVERIVNDYFDQGEDNLSPEEFRLYDLLGDLLENYEQRTLTQIPDAQPIELLKILMSQNGLRQKDLADIFSGQPNLSAVLKGRRRITGEQAKTLGIRFSVSPAAFI